jgi:hypothetical protein
MGTVTGEFNYVGGKAEDLIYYTDQPHRTRATWDPHVMPVHDMRHAATAPTLQNEGFTMARLPLDIGGKTDVEAVAAIYHPPLEKLLAQVTGAGKIVMQGAMMRWSGRSARPEIENSGVSVFVHSDFDREVFEAVSRGFVEDDPGRERWLSGRRGIVQTWRALSPPPQDRPLAVLDRRTITRNDLVRTRTVLGFEGNEQTFWHYTYRYNPAHRWSYISDMTSEDVLIFVGFDNAAEGLAGIPHQSFDFTQHCSETNPRWSYEVRAFVYWG